MGESVNSGGWGALDSLINGAASVLGQKNAAEIAAETQNNATAANAVASAQAAATKNNTMLYLGIGAVVLVVVVLVLRK
jgi:hypothetical protein